VSFRFASLGSGSSGNATIVALGNRAILIDCGFSVKECDLRLRALDFDPNALSAIFVTHEHGDHAKGVKALARKYRLPVYMSQGTSLAYDFSSVPQLHIVRADQSVELDGFSVMPVTVPHDAREPLQYVIRVADLKLGVLTDLGSYTPTIVSAYSDCDALLVEANHDLDMLHHGPYPYSLRQRVGGAWGHLNNQQTVSFLNELSLDCVQELVIGHISEKNNCLERVQSALADLKVKNIDITYATQNTGFDWIDVASKALEAS